MQHKIWLFLVIFLSVFLTQSYIWSVFPFVDQQFWLDQTQSVYNAAIAHTSTLTLSYYHGFAHPGTFPLLIASVLHWLGFSLLSSLRLAVSLLVAMSVTSYAFLACLLRPRSWWHLGAIIIFLTSHLYDNVNPLDAIVCAWIPLLLLYGCWLYERMPTRKMTSILFGLMIAVAFSTRLHITILTVTPLLLFLFFRITVKQWWIITISASALSYLFTPPMWQEPIRYFRIVLLGGSTYYNSASSILREQYHVSMSDIINIAPLAIISIFLAIIIILDRYHTEPLPKPFIGFLIVNSIITTTIFLSATMQVGRFLFPLVFLWESLLPLLIIHFIALIPNRKIYQKFSISLKPMVNFAVLLSIASTHLVPLTYAASFKANFDTEIGQKILLPKHPPV